MFSIGEGASDGAAEIEEGVATGEGGGDSSSDGEGTGGGLLFSGAAAETGGLDWGAVAGSRVGVNSEGGDFMGEGAGGEE